MRKRRLIRNKPRSETFLIKIRRFYVATHTQHHKSSILKIIEVDVDARTKMSITLPALDKLTVNHSKKFFSLWFGKLHSDNITGNKLHNLVLEQKVFKFAAFQKLLLIKRPIFQNFVDMIIVTVPFFGRCFVVVNGLFLR